MSRLKEQLEHLREVTARRINDLEQELAAEREAKELARKNKDLALADMNNRLHAERAATLREAADIASEAKAEDIAQRIRSLALWDGQSALDRERAEAREQALIDVQQFYNQSDMPKCQIFEDWLKRQFAAPRQAAGEPEREYPDVSGIERSRENG